MPKKTKTKTNSKPKKASRRVTYSTEEDRESKLPEFTSTAKPYQILEEGKELERLRVEQKQEVENEALLKKELEKPLGARNPTLMRKYASRVNESYSWPDIASKKYVITAYAPDSNDIVIEKRPYPYYANIAFTQHGSDFTYKFPISKFLDADGESFYKIDGTNTVIDSVGNISDAYSDSAVTPYVILKQFISGDDVEADAYKTSDGYYYFNFPGFRVSSEVKTDDGTAKVNKPNSQKFDVMVSTKWVDGKTGDEMKNPLKKDLILARFDEGIVMGEGVPIIDEKKAYIARVVNSVSNAFWVVYTRNSKLRGSGTPVLVGEYIAGLDNLKKELVKLDGSVPKTVFRSVATATDFVREWNKKKVEEFLKKK